LAIGNSFVVSILINKIKLWVLFESVQNFWQVFNSLSELNVMKQTIYWFSYCPHKYWMVNGVTLVGKILWAGMISINFWPIVLTSLNSLAFGFLFTTIFNIRINIYLLLFYLFLRFPITIFCSFMAFYFLLLFFLWHFFSTSLSFLNLELPFH